MGGSVYPLPAWRVFALNACFEFDIGPRPGRSTRRRALKYRIGPMVCLWFNMVYSGAKSIQKHLLVSYLLSSLAGRTRGETLVKRLFAWLVLEHLPPENL